MEQPKFSEPIDSIYPSNDGVYRWETNEVGEMFFISDYKYDEGEPEFTLVAIADKGETKFKARRYQIPYEADRGLSKKFNSLTTDFSKNINDSLIRRVILENKDNVISAFTLYNYGLDSYIQLANLIDKNVLNNTYYGKKILPYLLKIDILPKFIVKDSLGKTTTIEKFVDELTFVEFWADWKPNTEIKRSLKYLILPNLLKNNKKLATISISINEEKEWLEALKKDNYPWKQYNYDEILNKGPYFHKLGIKGPSGMLVEKSGKILAKNIKTSEELVKHLERYWGN